MIIQLEVGHRITPTRHLNPVMVANWTYGRECGNLGGGIGAGAVLQVVEVSKVPGNMWVRAEVIGQDPPATLKIAGVEYGNNFAAMP